MLTNSEKSNIIEDAFNNTFDKNNSTKFVQIIRIIQDLTSNRRRMNVVVHPDPFGVLNFTWLPWSWRKKRVVAVETDCTYFARDGCTRVKA